MNVIDKLCRRLEQANSQIQQLFRKNEESLVGLNLYNRFLEKPNDEQVLAYDRAVKEISLSLEVPAEAVARGIEQLSEHGIVTVQGNAIRLKNKTKLSELAEEIGG
jgi:CRP-like cAMP-binding protein